MCHIFNGDGVKSLKYQKMISDRMSNFTVLGIAPLTRYHDFWCRQKKLRAFKIWCSDMPPAAIAYGRMHDTDADPVVDIKLKTKDWAADGLTQVGEMALKHILDEKSEKSRNFTKRNVLRISVPCEFWFQVKVVEGSPFWDEFWKINEALEFNDEILQVGKNAKSALLNLFGSVAQEKARRFGYQFDKDLIQHGGYHVVHLRAEQDWHEHCKVWFSWREKRNNCMNNTFHIGNVLLSEGISPALPVYLATGLSEREIQALHHLPSMQIFLNIYTVVTKGMLGLPVDVGNKREYWAAVDYMFSQNADWFVGNSISTFSALTMEVRGRQKMPVLPYNGGTMALEDMNCIRSNTLTVIPPTRPDIKWLFTLPRNIEQNDLVYNMTMVAVKSAAAKTGLIPVCVTAEDPNSTVLVKLVSMGVRVIYHRPAWLESAERYLQQKNVTLAQLDALLAQWLRIDIPIIGIMDEFVLYTDLDVLFIDDIFWKDLLGKNHFNLRDSLLRKMVGRAFFQDYAPTGRVGIPRFLGVAGRWGSMIASSGDDIQYDCGVMLMNLRNLRESHEQFWHLAVHKGWKQLLNLANLHGSDPCIYNSLYKKSNLPEKLVWKPHRPEMARRVHFEGLNCHADIAPYIRYGGGRTQPYRQRVEECFEIDFCRSSYLEFCADYDAYLR